MTRLEAIEDCAARLRALNIAYSTVRAADELTRVRAEVMVVVNELSQLTLREIDAG